jgi:hypothetical protein
MPHQELTAPGLSAEKTASAIVPAELARMIFFRHAEAEYGRPAGELRQSVLALVKLVGHRLVTDDGARDQMGEKPDEAGKRLEVARRFRLSAVEVDGVAQGHERVKRYARREQHLHDAKVMRSQAQRRKDMVYILHCKHVVLEENKEPHVADDRRDQGGFSFPLDLAGRGDYLSARIVPGRGQKHEDHEPGHEPAVKNVTGNGDKVVLEVKALPLERKGVINRQKNGQEIKKENMRRKNHDSLKKMVRKGLIIIWEIH